MEIEKDALIIDELVDLLENGGIPPGGKLPSENTLAERYRVPRYTVRNALNHLEERGLIESIQGKGRFLKPGPARIRMSLSGRTSFTEKMKELGHQLETAVVSCVPSDNGEAARALAAGPDDTVWRIGRLRVVDGEPMAIHYSHVLESRFPEIGEEGPGIRSMFEYYRERGYGDFESGKSVLSVVFPSSLEQELLSCSRLVPLLALESSCLDGRSGDTLEYTRILYRSDTFKYEISDIQE
ncbi:GntR family transcriptional regulator [Bhargavaea beijingensis]|nr:GntR family transcriptional regulator [Bhargavaea beijingensis]MCW1927912.1 GntR family transcriptional regulator [Bhargavaea beijingensis]